VQQEHVLWHRFLLSYASVQRFLGGLRFSVFEKLPLGFEVIIVDEPDEHIVHVARAGL
jgi:hypothetical protein